MIQNINRNKHVCQVIKGLGRGGAERLLLSTVRHFPPDWKVTVVYFLPYKDHLVQDFQKLGCEVILLPARNQATMLMQIPALVRLLREKGIGILHAHLPWAGIVSRLAGRIAGVPVVYTEHNLFSHYRLITRIVSRATYSLQHMVLAVSEAVAFEAGKVAGRVPVKILENAVDTREFSPERYSRPELCRVLGLPPNAFIVGTVTALTPQKRIDRWILTALRISEFLPEAFFVIVGDGILRTALESQAAPLIHSGRIIFAGRVADPVRWMACMDIFMMTSDFEGMPVALLESMSMRCVPVSTPAGGIPSVLSDDINGMIIEFDETPEITAGKIARLRNDPGMRERLSAKARETVESRHHITRLAEELVAVYSSIQFVPNPYK